ncbi:hypothetical protein [Desulforamulus hydrothermalis]|uniref:hypothetical protein n=1 Tax=Desulforamulus hydrothermalis TaxID=412895 RepID=UPI0002E4E0B6|nr:hypothetical protein [Desulforamulus hydrothermalis]SHG96944.1 hypothetical protein SAMN02745177_00935 [Desulforamulus hydrothermalis Lam5 = DSM 18033]
MANTSNSAELKNCIQNAQDCMMNMGKTIDKLPGNAPEKQELAQLCRKTGILLEEARQRCQQLF